MKKTIISNKKLGIVFLTLLLGLAVCFTLLFTSLYFGTAHALSSLDSLGLNTTSEYWNDVTARNTSSLEDEFSSSTISVVLTRRTSLQLRMFSTSDFPELELLSVEHLSAYSEENVRRQLNEAQAGLRDINNRCLETDVYIGRFRQILSLTLEEPCKENVLRSIRLLEQRDDVYAASPDYYFNFYDPIESEADEQFQVANTTTSNWHLQRIGMQNVWAITTGSNAVSVGIIDSGVDRNHPNLSALIHPDASMHGDFTGQNDPFRVSSSFPGNHGTQVAGVVAAQGNSSIGINRHVSLVSLRVPGTAATWNANANAILHANARNIPIVNFSIGSETMGNHAATRQAIAEFNGLFVAAAGNANQNNDRAGSNKFPARLTTEFDHVMAVGSSNRNDGRAGHSNWGANSVCLFAPGEEVYTANPRWRNWFWQDWRYTDTTQGTSFAAPHVAGTAALLMSVDPALRTDPARVREIIRDTATRLPAFNGISVTGGRLNAYEAVRSVMPFTSRVLNAAARTAEITGATSPLVGSFEIPSIVTLNGVEHTVTAIGPSAFANQQQLTQISIPSTVGATIRNSVGDGCEM